MRVKNTEKSWHQMVKVPMSSTVRPVSPPAWLVSEIVALDPVYREVILPSPELRLWCKYNRLYEMLNQIIKAIYKLRYNRDVQYEIF